MRLTLAAVAALSVCGCALLTSEGETKDFSFPWSKTRDAEDNAVLRQAAGIEAGIIRRPGSDIRIRKLVWEHLDESGLMAPEVRHRLNESGFRVGVAGSSSPWALQSLAKEATASQAATDTAQPASTGPISVGPRFTVMAGGTSRLEIQPIVNHSGLPLEQIEELAGVRDFSNMKCAFELTVKELDSDWALISLLPQLHVGSQTARLSFEAVGEKFPVRQRVIPLYEHQFEIRLHRGEVAVVGLQQSDDWNLGRLFFAPDDSHSGQESILLIRLAGIDTLKGESADPNSIASKYRW